jgi:hypothetical protein
MNSTEGVSIFEKHTRQPAHFDWETNSKTLNMHLSSSNQIYSYHIKKSDQNKLKLDTQNISQLSIATHKSHIPPHTGIQIAAFDIGTGFQTRALKNQDF